MASAHKVPGVYREDVYVRPAAALPTGVPGFAGFGEAKSGAGAVLLYRADDLAARFQPAAGSYLAEVVAGFFGNGGKCCYVSGAAATADPEKSLTQALASFAPLADLDLVAVPDVSLLDADAAQRVQKAALTHCHELGNRFAILDAPPREDATDAVALQELKTWRAKLVLGAANPANAALYFPWIKVMAADGGVRAVPPCGHVAGVFARSDERVGVHKAPANEELLGALDIESTVDAAMQEVLNPDGVNCLRAFPGRGLRVWGARTLSSDADWRYVNVRRLFLTLARWIDRSLAWAAYEPNSPRLWLRIQRQLNVHLAKLWQAGALKGGSAAEAFYVKCDAETNPAEARELGRVVTEIGLAPALPAEFVVVRIIHRAGAAQFV